MTDPDLDFGVVHEKFLHKLTNFQKYDIILKHKKPAKNFIFLQIKTKDRLFEIA